MEVLKTDDKLKEEIINDANIKSERMLKKAKSDIEEIEKGTALQIEQFEQENNKTVKKSIEIETKKIFASVDIEVKKKTLDITGKLINETFMDIKRSIEDGSLFNYREFILKLIQNASKEMNSPSYSIEIGKAELQKLSKESLKSLKLTGGDIKDIIEKEIEGLMLFSQDRKQGVFVSLDDFIRRLEEEERIKVYEILLQGARN